MKTWDTHQTDDENKTTTRHVRRKLFHSQYLPIKGTIADKTRFL